MMRALFAVIVIGFILALPSCQPEKPLIDNQEEVITRMIYALTPQGGGTPVLLTYSDADGDGGNAPVITGGTLQAGTTYNGVITLFNETVTPAENVHEEVQEEDEEHQFFFPNTITGLTVVYADQDANGLGTGLKTTLTTGAAGTGDLTVVLKHEPTKVSGTDATKNGVAAGGETDVEAKFSIVVQ